MNDLELIKTEEDLPSLWERTKAEQKSIENERARLGRVIESEVSKLYGEEKEEISKQRGAESERVQSLLTQIDELDYKIVGAVGKGLLYSFATFVVLMLLQIFIKGFVIVNGFLTYLIFIAVSVGVFCLVNSLYSKKYSKEKAPLENDEEVKQFRAKEKEISNKYFEKRTFVKEEKYKSKFDELDTREEQNGYELVRKAMILYTYGNCVFIHISKMSHDCYCEMKLNGVTAKTASRAGTVMLRLNPGYTAVELNFIYHCKFSDGSVTHREATVNFQASAEECPMFIHCIKFDGYDAKCEHVGSDEFEKVSRKSLID